MAAGGAAAAAAIAQAIKASGAIVQVEPKDFQIIFNRVKDGVVVMAEGGFFSKSYKYLTNYRGLHFYTESPEPMNMPSSCEIIYSKKICIP